MKNRLYPLKFIPLFKDKIWGGNKIHTKYNFNYKPLPNCGEMWLLSGVNANQTIIKNGFLAGNELNELVEIYMGELVGEKVYEKFGNTFPILIKIIDTIDNLSIQVHPNNEIAQTQGYNSGKTEMWYVINADKDAIIYDGFNKKLQKDELLTIIDNNKIKENIRTVNVHDNDVFFMPSGKVHALGKGLLIAEIQQTSDLTYRIFDWDRIDNKGNKRELHIDKALKSIDFDMIGSGKINYELKSNATTNLVDCKEFTTNLLKFDNSIIKDISSIDSFIIYTCIDGNILIEHDGEDEPIVNLLGGESILVPADIENISLTPRNQSITLETYMKI